MHTGRVAIYAFICIVHSLYINDYKDFVNQQYQAKYNIEYSISLKQPTFNTNKMLAFA